MYRANHTLARRTERRISIKPKRHWYKEINIWLVLGTWALAILTLWSTCRVDENMQNQTTAMNKATELDWRPYLEIEHSDRDMAIYYEWTADSLTNNSVVKPVDRISRNSDSPTSSRSSIRSASFVSIVLTSSTSTGLHASNSMRRTAGWLF